MANSDKAGTGHCATYTKEGLLGVINGLPLAVAVIDADRKLALANNAACRLLNSDEARLIGLVGGRAFGCIHHKDAPEGCGYGKDCQKCKLRMTVKDTLENRTPHFMVDAPMVFKLHGKRHLRITTQPLVFQGSAAVLLSIEDATESIQHEQTKLDKEKLAAVIHTAGGVCHEINQPLMAILGFAELLIGELSQGGAVKAHIMEIKEQAERLGAVTNKLMTITQYKTKLYLNSEILDIDAATLNAADEFKFKEERS